MRNALIAVIAVGAGAWLLLNYGDVLLSPLFWRRWLPIGVPHNSFTLALVVISLLILLAWACFRKTRL